MISEEQAKTELNRLRQEAYLVTLRRSLMEGPFVNRGQRVGRTPTLDELDKRPVGFHGGRVRRKR